MSNLTRKTARAIGALARFTKRSLPRRMLPAFAVCLLVPGPVDEIVLLAVVLAVVLRSAEKRRELRRVLREAWQGTCTEQPCTECGAPAGQSCDIWCIADQA